MHRLWLSSSLLRSSPGPGDPVGRKFTDRDLVRDTDVVYDVANTVVSKYLVRKQSRVSVPGGASGPLGRAVQYPRLQMRAVKGAYLAMTLAMTNRLLAPCRSNVTFHLRS